MRCWRPATQLNERSDDYTLSVNDFVIRAAALALRKVPAANASWVDGALRQYASADVSVAVAVEDGLVTPIVRNADGKGLAEISAEVKELAGRARAKPMGPRAGRSTRAAPSASPTSACTASRSSRRSSTRRSR